jgi:hypothetical protein
MMFEPAPMLLLKLHGSANWRVKYGVGKPYSPESVVFYASWGKLPGWGHLGLAEPTLERQPFMVPPVLMKEHIHKEPVLRMVWTKAYKILKEADHVVFLGYSFPPTDIAARYLFVEAIDDKAKVDVVVKTRYPDRIKTTYEDALPRKQLEFHIADAREWLHAHIK